MENDKRLFRLGGWGKLAMRYQSIIEHLFEQLNDIFRYFANHDVFIPSFAIISRHP